MLNKNLSKQNTYISYISYILLLAPIILGLGSGYFVSRRRIPKVKSSINPPSWLFGVVWPILYLLIGYSSYLIWNALNINMSIKKFYLFLYAIQVLMVMAWWPYFVYYPNKIFSTITLILLAIFALIITILFFPINNIAAYCFIPYVVWLSFASYLSSQT
jgi:tryptophan-rich sensory protein